MNELLIQQYLSFGFELYLSTDKKNIYNANEENILKSPDLNSPYSISSINRITSDKISNSKGVGVFLKNNLCALDIDGCLDKNLLHNLLSFLGLDNQYEWVVQSGSKIGYHILFYCEIPERKKKDFSDALVNAYYSSYDNRPFSKIEFKWGDNLILPPSLHITGSSYKFLNRIPKNKPQKIAYTSLLTIKNYYCSLQAYESRYGEGDYGELLSMTIEFIAKSDKDSANIFNHKLRENKYLLINSKAYELNNIYGMDAFVLCQTSILIIDTNLNIIKRDFFNYLDNKSKYQNVKLAEIQSFNLQDLKIDNRKIVFSKIANYFYIKGNLKLIYSNSKYISILQEGLSSSGLLFWENSSGNQLINELKYRTLEEKLYKIISLESYLKNDDMFSILNEKLNFSPFNEKQLLVETYVLYFLILIYKNEWLKLKEDNINISDKYLSDNDVEAILARQGITEENDNHKKYDVDDYDVDDYNGYRDNDYHGTSWSDFTDRDAFDTDEQYRDWLER